MDVLIARRSLSNLRLALVIPNDCLLAASADDNRFMGLGGLDQKHRALALVDALAHPCIDEKNQAVALEHSTALALNTVGEFDLAWLMALHQVSNS